MIDENILKSLESNIQDPSYSVIVSKFNQPKFCNKNRLEITLKQYNPNLEKIIENKENIIEILKNTLTSHNISIPNSANAEQFVNSCVEKTLTIDSNLNTDTKNSLFISELIGSISNEEEKPVTSARVLFRVDKEGIKILQKDTPNYFNKTKFRMNSSGKIIVSVPKKVESILIISKKTNANGVVEKITNFSTIEDQKVTMNYTKSFLTNNGYFDMELRYTLRSDITTQKIESITTQFQKEIELSFNYEYEDVPGIIITMDEDKKPFGSYIVNFYENENNKINGCKITFKNVKRMKDYDNLNITIISPNG